MQLEKVRTKVSLIFSAVFFIALFFYLWLRINPSFYVLEQNIAYQGTWRFLQDYLSYPGGIIDYCSAFLSVFFIYPIVGALSITVLLLVIAYAAYQILWLLFGPRKWFTAHLFPVVFCGALQSNYDHSLSMTFALAVALLAFIFYGYQSFRRISVRVLLYMVLAGGLYYAAGGAFLLFSLLCMLFESINNRQWAIGLFYGVVAAIAPYLMKTFVFLVSTHDAYLKLLPFGDLGYNIPILPYVLYAFFPALFFVTFCVNLLKGKDFIESVPARLFQTFGIWIRFAISGTVLVAVTVVAFMFSFHRNDYNTLHFSSLCLKSQWAGILKEAEKNPSHTTLITNFAVSQALFYKGLLPVDLFSFPQNTGARGLFLSGDETAANRKLEGFAYFFRGELAFKLGLVNSAQHWYYEALSTQTATADVLKRLSQVHALKGDVHAARACLSMLATMPMQGKWAEQFSQRIEDGSLIAADPELTVIKKSMPTADFLLADSRQPYHDCDEAVQQHPANRMTFEYCMASHLLLCNVRKIAAFIGYLDTLGYAGIPLLYEQALVMLKAGNYPIPAAMAGRISQKTLEDFLEVDNILYQFQGNLPAAREAMHEKFWNSYWYYHFYMRPIVAGNR